MRVALFPFTIVLASIRVYYNSFTVRDSLIKASLVPRAIWESYKALLIYVEFHHGATSFYCLLCRIAIDYCTRTTAFCANTSAYAWFSKTSGSALTYKRTSSCELALTGLVLKFIYVYGFSSISQMNVFAWSHITNNHKNSTLPLAFFRCTVLICLDAFSERFTLIPVAFITTTVWPNFNTKTFWLSLVPLAVVDLAIWKLALTR